MPGGRGNKAIDQLPAELRAHIEALIAEGVPAAKIYEDFPAVQAVMSERTLRETIQHIKDDNRFAIYMQNKRMFDRLIDEFGGDLADKSDAERIAYAATIKGMLGGGKVTTQLNGVDAFLQVHKHWRKAEEHRTRMALLEFQRQVKARAVEAEKSKTTDAKSKAEAYAEIARMLDEEIRKRDAA